MTALRLRRGQDHIEVLHCFNPQSTQFKPANLQPEAIKARYTADLKNYSLTWLDKGPQPTRSCVVNYVNSCVLTKGVSFLIVGVVGRRGPDDSPRVLGSVADLACRAVYAPTILVKRGGGGGGGRRS